MLLELDVGKLRARLLPRLESGRPTDDIRAMLRAFAEEQNIPVQP
jgi:phosphotransferase system enzyme I (PtsP)